MTPEDIKGMFDSDRRYFEKLYKMPSQNSRGEKAVASDSEDDKPKRLTTAKLLKFVQEHYDLAFNEMSRELELNGQPLRNEPYILLAKDHNIEAGKDKALDIFSEIAKENAYNPVKDYLEKCSKNTLPIDISNLASRYFGTSNPLYDKFVERMLISAVARVYEPGCKVDTALILQGAQGLGKSTFFDVLGGEYFDDSMGNGSDKDDLLTLHKSWIQEWGELDRIFGKRQVGEVKHFLSKRKDNYRVPYGRKTECYPRHSIIVGSVNDAQFLNDPTGDRRFWVIPVAVNEIDTETLKKERDSIWSAAVAKYKSGEQWWLSRQEQLESNRNNSGFRTNDEWETIIEDYLQNQTITSTYELLTQALDFEPKQIDGKARIRVADCLKALGWQKSSKKTTYQGKRQYTWHSFNSVTENQGCQKGDIAKTLSQSEDGTDVTDGISESPTLTEMNNNDDNLNCSHSSQLSQEKINESVPSVTDDAESSSSRESEGVSPPEQETVTTETFVPDIQPGDTIKHKRWDGKIVTDKVEQVESYWNDGTLRISHESGSISSNSDDLLEIINQWGQIKWKR
jgi:predicted P-loop ATPase